MATPPTFVSRTTSGTSHIVNQNNGTYTISSVAVENGDLLVVVGYGESGIAALATPAGGSLTYTLRQDPNSAASAGRARTWIWTAPATSTTSFNITSAASGGNLMRGLDVWVFRSHGGVGASGGATDGGTAPSQAITNTGDNSAVIAASSDFNSIDGASRTWRTINSITPTAGNSGEKLYLRNASQYAVYGAYWSDAGAAGSKTTGLTAPTGQLPCIAAVEILGTTTAAAAKPKSLNYQAAVYRSYYW